VKDKKKILVAPLNWGIGHATRCIPIINILKEQGFTTIIMASGRSLELLSKEFPNDKIIKLTDYNISYSTFLPMSLNILLQIPKILYRIYLENRQLDSIINDFKIDGIISDNRYGLYSKKIPSVFITHQLEIQSKYLKKLIQKINYYFINKFTKCWIPDYPKDGLAGDLSHPKKNQLDHEYIGPLSRFVIKPSNLKYDIIALVSGPEPQRSIFENLLIKALKDKTLKSLLLQGKPGKKFSKKINNLTIMSHLKGTELNQAILDSNIIICRSGYSTIMDLITLEKNATLIPTPGQTEQEYLARFLADTKLFNYQEQSNFNLNQILKSKKSLKKISAKTSKVEWEELLKVFD